MAGGRDTGLQVVHYVSRLLTSGMLDIETGVRIGELPPGAALLRARVVCTEGFGAGRDLILFWRARTQVDIDTIPVATPGVIDGTVPATEILSAGRDLFARLDTPPAGVGAALVIVSYIPKVG